MTTPRRTILSILAASDLGPASDKVVRSAAALAGRLGAELHLLHALDLEKLPPPAGAGGDTSFPERTRQAERALTEQAERAASPVRPASLRVVNYVPDRAIRDRAAEVSADLIVVGPHSGGEVGAHFLGTTADRVIRSAEVPCLVAPVSLSLPARRIGVPTDFSDPARAALGLALDLVGRLGDAPGAEIRVFHVGWSVERVDVPELGEEEFRPRMEQQVRDVMAGAGEPSPVPVRTEVVWGVSPAEAIAKHARDAELDLLVLGTRGEGGLKRLLIGSVASGVARQAPCPVLLVPPRGA